MQNQQTPVEDTDDRIIYLDDFRYRSYPATIEPIAPDGSRQSANVDDQHLETEDI